MDTVGYVDLILMEWVVLNNWKSIILIEMDV
jgi:hypothetical protein